MPAEDDDLSMRVITSGKYIHILPIAQITELSPYNIYSLLCQRLRWTVGYEKSTNKHLCRLATKRPRMLLQRLYPYFTYLMVFANIVQISISSRSPFSWKITTTIIIVFASCNAIVLFLSILRMLHLNNWKNTLHVLLAMPCVSLYSIFQTIMTIYARIRMSCGRRSWSSHSVDASHVTKS